MSFLSAQVYLSPVGIGVFSTAWINAGGWVEQTVENKTGQLKYTPFGRHLTHCETHFNVVLKERTKGEFWNYAVTSIPLMMKLPPTTIKMQQCFLVSLDILKRFIFIVRRKIYPSLNLKLYNCI